jgi:hypothetical protein
MAKGDQIAYSYSHVAEILFTQSPRGEQLRGASCYDQMVGSFGPSSVNGLESIGDGLFALNFGDFSRAVSFPRPPLRPLGTAFLSRFAKRNERKEGAERRLRAHLAHLIDLLQGC